MLPMFQDIIIRGKYSTLEHIMGRLAEGRPPKWKRALDKEPDRSLVANPAFLALRLLGDAHLPSAIAFVRQTPSDIRVANILREDHEDLSTDQYNAIIRQLHHDLIIPSVSSQEAEVVLTDPEVSITHWLTPEAAKLLQAFSKSANRWNLHTYDQERWIAFLIAVHQDQNSRNLTATDLVRWLVDEDKWPEDPAVRLGEEFEFAEEILRSYDQTVGRAR